MILCRFTLGSKSCFLKVTLCIFWKIQSAPPTSFHTPCAWGCVPEAAPAPFPCSPGAGAWALESAQGGTRTYHTHTPGSTGPSSGGDGPLHTGHMWELEKNATEVRERKREWYSLEQHLKCCRLSAAETSTSPAWGGHEAGFRPWTPEE